MAIRRLAPAKINLFLRVAAPDPHGYHPLQSLIAFCDFGDDVVFENNASQKIELTIEGLFSKGLSKGEDNLILKAVRAFEKATKCRVSGEIKLRKALPVASGIGGGSSDAGAILNILRSVYAPDMPSEALEAVAASIGSDGAMCLWGRSCFASHYGEVVQTLRIPKLPVVLINPNILCATSDIYKSYDGCGKFSELIENIDNYNEINIDRFWGNLRDSRNDLQSVACAKLPILNEILEYLNRSQGVRIARMSGSGATCFALCGSKLQAEELSKSLQNKWPDMWIRQGYIN